MLDYDEINNYVKSYYNEKHPDYIITNRISEKLMDIIINGLSQKGNITNDKIYQGISRLLEKDKILSFICDRQPCLEPIGQDVFETLNSYLKSKMPEYRVLNIYRKSNHPEDNYLYSVVGYNVNNNTFCCWSSWNMSLATLNNGHYMLNSQSDAIAILQEQFNDITDESSKYGLLSNSYDNAEAVKNEINKQLNMDNVVPFRHKGR